MIKQKIIKFASKNWKEILIIFALSLVVVKTQMDYRALIKAYETSKEEMQLQINSLKDIHAKEIEQREENQEVYDNSGVVRETPQTITDDYTARAFGQPGIRNLDDI